MNLRRNNIFKSICVVSLVILLITAGHPQTNIPIGTWRNHIAYGRAQLVHKVENEIFCITENGLFIYTPEDNGIQILSKIIGLSDVSVSAINNQAETNLIILGYDNGNIDLIKDREIFNITDIKNVDISYGKKILDIEIYDNLVYFIMEFGVVVYNKEQNAIKETWQNLSNSGDFLKIIKGSVLRDTLFLATEQGVIAGDLDPGNNLLDYRNWRRYQIDEGLPQELTRDIESYKENLYSLINEHTIYRYENGYWNQEFEQLDGTIFSLKSSTGSLTFTLSDRVYYLSENQSLEEITDERFLSLRNAIFSDGDLYAADFINGLVHIRSGSSEVIRPSGPFSNDVYKIYNYGENMLAVPKGFDDQYQPLRNTDGFYFFSSGHWSNFNNSGGFGYEPLPDVKDIVDIAYNEIHNNIYFASFGYGLLEWDLGSNFRIYNEQDPKVTLINSNPPEPFTLIPAIDVDNSGRIWMSNYNTNLPLQNFDYPESWTGYGITSTGSSNIIDFIVASDNTKWMVVHPDFGGGIIVYEEENGEIRRLTSQAGSGSLPDNEVTAIIEDLEGQIWIGTTDGVAYFPFPFLVFDDPEFEAIRPVYENNFLFKNEKITCLEIDGGNRKWIGTGKGAWHFSMDGTELITNFDMSNSPILSERIIDIEINQVSGEVFFGTDKGMISFRGDAVTASEKHSNVKIFPNPVTPNFNGLVGIEGLPQNSIVKITDIVGNLIYETRSEGGIATWNVVDYEGKRPNTGIYLVFSSTDDGSDTFVGKLAIVR
jgi:hypothetical protein